MATASLGRVALAWGDTHRALQLGQEALSRFEKLNNRPGLSYTHYTIAQTYLKLADPGKALKEIEVSLSLAERQRAETPSLDLRAFYFATRQHYWELYIDILMTLDQLHPKQGFAARELVTRWAEIAGPEVAAHSEPLKIQWPRPVEGQPQEPATLVLRVEGPMALEIQHASDVILQRVNRFFGWSAVGRLALRQAPLSRRDKPKTSRTPDAAEVAELEKTLSSVEDEELRAALARLGASIKRN